MHPPPCPICYFIQTSLLLAVSCAPDLPAQDPVSPYITATITDFAEQQQPSGDIPHRPVFSLRNGPDDPEWPLYLLRSPLTETLVEDLRTPTLRKQHQTLSVPIARTKHGSIEQIRPIKALIPGERYTLAIPLTGSTRPFLPPNEPWALEVEVGVGPGYGSQFTHSLPAPGQIGVKPTLPHITVIFDGPISNCEGLQLAETTTAERVPSHAGEVSCETLDDTGYQCCRLTPDFTLDANADYAVDLSALTDARGAPPSRARLDFATGPKPQPSSSGPQVTLQPTPCAEDELPIDDIACLLASDHGLTIRTNIAEPALLALTLHSDIPRSAHSLTQQGWGSIGIENLASGRRWPATLTATTSNGGHLSRTFEVHTNEKLPKITIVEVRSDPLGAEPTQEYVELLNYGQVPVDLVQFTLTDRAMEQGKRLSKAHTMLPPGSRILLVPDGYALDDGFDVPTPPGTTLLRLGTSIANSGLANRGEPLFLRDLRQRRVSATPAIDTPAGDCLRRLPESPPRSAAPLDFTTGPCDPGK